MDLEQKLIEKLAEKVHFSDMMYRILKEQEAALKTDNAEALLKSLNNMDECRCQLLDVDKAISALKESREGFEQAIGAAQAKELIAKADSLLKENMKLILSNRELIGSRVKTAPEDLKELLRQRALSLLPPERVPESESISIPQKS